MEADNYHFDCQPDVVEEVLFLSKVLETGQIEALAGD